MKINIKKNDLAQQLSREKGYSVLYSKKLINDLIFSIVAVLSKSNLNLKNFGVFKISKKKQRIGRNPKTKETYIINSRKHLRFISSKKLKSFVNNF